MPPPDKDLLMIIVGGDALALSTARELCQLRGRRIVVLWPADAEFARAVEGVGADFVAGRPDSRDGLETAGVGWGGAVPSFFPQAPAYRERGLLRARASPRPTIS